MSMKRERAPRVVAGSLICIWGLTFAGILGAFGAQHVDRLRQMGLAVPRTLLVAFWVGAGACATLWFFMGRAYRQHCCNGSFGTVARRLFQVGLIITGMLPIGAPALYVLFLAPAWPSEACVGQIVLSTILILQTLPLVLAYIGIGLLLAESEQKCQRCTGPSGE